MVDKIVYYYFRVQNESMDLVHKVFSLFLRGKYLLIGFINEGSMVSCQPIQASSKDLPNLPLAYLGK